MRRAGLEHTARVGAVAGQARQQGTGIPDAALSEGRDPVQQAAAAKPPHPARTPAYGSDADTGGELMRLLLRQVRRMSGECTTACRWLDNIRRTACHTCRQR
jgi:hypothetical protein